MTITQSISQSPDKSILDFFGRQVYLGNGFGTGTTTQTIGSNSETPWVLLNNPAGSGASLFSYTRKHSIITTNSNIATFRYYANPTVTANGTALAISNSRINSNSPASIAAAFQGPTVSNNGIQLTGAAATTGSGIPFIAESLVIIDPGNSILVTVQSSGSPNPVGYQILWYEIAYPG